MLDFSTYYVLRTTYFCYSAFHVERLLILRIVFAVEDFRETAHRIRK